jgi:putative transcriptional regulator
VTGNHGRLSGRLLVAEPMLGDPNFDRTVVLVIEHTDEGALGIVLNRPTDVLVAETLAEWRELATEPAVLHVGGPVEERSIWCLARAIDPHDLDGFVPVLGDLGLLDLRVDPASVHAWLTSLRLYAGYSGWGAGQLEHELASESWFVVDADVDDPFLADSADLWPRILARQGGSLSRLATFPRDPSMN